MLIEKTNGFRSHLTKEQIFKKWEELENKYFHNPSVTLIGAVKLGGKNTSEYTWTRNIPEDDAVRRGSLSLGTKKVRDALLDALDSEDAMRLNDYMNQHYQHLLQSLNTAPDDADASQLMNYYRAGSNNDLDKLSKRINFTNPSGHLKKILRGEADWSEDGPFNGASLSQILYGAKLDGPTGKLRAQLGNGAMAGTEGKIHDAYMNHIAARHRIILKWLTNISTASIEKIETEFAKHKGMKIEEGANFIPALTGGLNSISWQSGGDIVVYNRNKKVVYNIQLKTTISKTQSYHISVAKLATSLHELRSRAESGAESVAQFMFDNFYNDAANIAPDFENKVDVMAIDLAKKALGI